jgi:6,7-dimethyl-8-ribityllumazine synthase
VGPQARGAETYALILALTKEETMNQLNPYTKTPTIPTQGKAEHSLIAFVQACWHKEIVDQCRIAFLDELAKCRPELKVDVFEVPGAFEIPLQAKLLARTGRYQAVVAAGLIVDGGIYRHEFVAQTVVAALMQVQLEVEVPIISAVLTPQQFHDHKEHRKFFRDHLAVKGIEAAAACCMTINRICEVKRL